MRQEVPQDYERTDEVIRLAFLSAEHTDHNEHKLVQRLRKSPHFDANLSLVAVLEGEIIGHILFTPIEIRSPEGIRRDSLALAPVSVLPEHRRKGVGSKLILAGHKMARRAGYLSVILLGHPSFYPKFGYRPAHEWGITAPLNVPPEAFMALELAPQGLSMSEGVVAYPPEFGIKVS